MACSFTLPLPLLCPLFYWLLWFSNNLGSSFCNFNYRYEALYAKMLPESMLGETFLEKYADHHDPVTVIDHKCIYGVKAPAKHPIFENFRVKVRNCF